MFAIVMIDDDSELYEYRASVKHFDAVSFPK
jgi:hypothetical protein